MAIPNINQITTTLRRMSDQQLQQYAAMHKNDPYILPMAIAESNARKQMRSAQSMGQQPQQKVADASIAGMLPEDQGIGALPAQNIQNMADGGIAGYAPSNNSSLVDVNTPVVRMADGGIPRYNEQGLVRLPNEDFATYRRRIFDAELQAQRERNEIEENKRTAEQQRMLAARGEGNQVPPSPFFERAPLITSATPAVVKPAASVPSSRDDNFRRQTDPRMAGTPAVSSAVPLITSGAALAPGTKPVAPGAADTLPGQTQSGEAGIEALQKKYFDPLDQEIGGLRNARAGLVSGIADLAEKNLAATKADIEKRGDVYKGREERLAKQEKGLETTSDKYTGLALLQAGAAMMTTRGGLSMALGRGVDVGSRQYAAGMEKINAAKDKFSEARDRLDDLRINRSDMNAKEIRAAEKDVRESQLKGQELFYNGLVSDLGIKQKNVTAIFGAAADDLKTTRTIAAERANTITRESGANTRNAATIAAQTNTPDRLVFDQLIKANQGDAVKAAEALQKMKAEKFNMYEAYSKYLTGFAGKDTLTPPLAFDQFASQFAIPTTKAPGKGATVLTQP